MSTAVTSNPRLCKAKHPPATQVQSFQFQWRHILLFTEQRADRHLVFVKLRGEHPQATGPTCLIIVTDGLPHRVASVFQQSVLHIFMSWWRKDTTNILAAMLICIIFVTTKTGCGSA